MARFSSSNWLLIGLAGLCIVGLRVAAAANDLWMDEVWTLRQIAGFESPVEIFTRLSQDNHPLYTLYYYAVGPRGSAWTYRMPAILAGLASVVFAAWIGARQAPGAPERSALLAALLVGFSYMGIHYGSEARGYAPSLALSLLAFAALLEGRRDPGLRWPLLYAVALGLALTAQPVAATVLLAGGVYTAVGAGKGPWLGLSWLRTMLRWHAAPTAFLAFYWLAYVRHLETGGGPKLAPSSVLNEVAAFTFGFPIRLLPTPISLSSIPWEPAAILALCVVIWGLARLWRANDELWVFYLVGILVAPLAMEMLRDSEFIYPRFYFVSGVLALLLLSYALAAEWERSRRAIVVGLVALFVLGNAVHTSRLLRYGRGEYTDAVDLMAAQTPTPVIVYGGFKQFRMNMILGYHLSRRHPERRLRHAPLDRLPLWYIVHSQDSPAPAVVDRFEEAGVRYERVATYDYAALSGWRMWLYKRLPASRREP